MQESVRFDEVDDGDGILGRDESIDIAADMVKFALCVNISR